MEQEFRIMLPQEISIHAARITLHEVMVTQLLKMEKEIKEEAEKLADADVDVIGFGCTTGSLAGGFGYDKKIVSLIEKTTHKPGVITAGAVVEALRMLGLSRISVATPYTEEVDALERRFLEQSGFAIEKMAGLGLTDNLKIARVEASTVFNLVKKVDSTRTEGVFVSCTNLPTIEVITQLEETLKKPVISSNSATMWAMLKKINYSLKTERLGKLFLRA